MTLFDDRNKTCEKPILKLDSLVTQRASTDCKLSFPVKSRVTNKQATVEQTLLIFSREKRS